MKRRSRTTGQSTVATFDFAARREFVTGATHRKELRRRDAQARLLEKRKEERRLLRAERREKIREHINHVNRSQQLAAAAANPNLKAHSLKDNISCSSKTTNAPGGMAALCALKSLCILPNILDYMPVSHPPLFRSDDVLNSRKACSVQPPQRPSANVIQAVRLLPAEAPEGASVSPWHIASCVSLSLGGFPQPREPEAEASPAASTDSGLPSSRPPLRSSLQVKESKAEVSPLPSGEAEETHQAKSGLPLASSANTTPHFVMGGKHVSD
ncbi:hypothetical protein cyc_03099 [Cyclospora cayetanensis]|uniref:Uncharacterized protein n=1 Tax=Cyclospora cayetanensis TaxID=88456 RepID=A0A1D3D473_9EIME|nr:hypothetical protein cyc_03099 [Cyclospora cayetanensis]